MLFNFSCLFSWSWFGKYLKLCSSCNDYPSEMEYIHCFFPNSWYYKKIERPRSNNQTWSKVILSEATEDDTNDGQENLWSRPGTQRHQDQVSDGSIPNWNFNLLLLSIGSRYCYLSVLGHKMNKLFCKKYFRYLPYPLRTMNNSKWNDLPCCWCNWINRAHENIGYNKNS